MDEVHRAVKHVVAQIERAVHVEQKQAGVDESFVVHGFIPPEFNTNLISIYEIRQSHKH